MAASVFPTPFPTGFRLIDGNDLNKQLATPLLSSQDGITAKAGGGKTNAFQLSALLNRVSVAATAADSVKLPASQVGLEVVVENDGASAIQVYGAGTDTINGVATATGVSQPAGNYTTYRCTTLGAWRTASAALTSSAPVSVGATKTLTTVNANAPILLDTPSGSAVTLPAVSGSGAVYKFIVTATTITGSHKILAASSADFLMGLAEGENATTAKVFASAASTNHSIQMPFSGSQPSGGFIGDWFTFTDVGNNYWAVQSQYQAGTTPTTPFSAATS